MNSHPSLLQWICLWLMLLLVPLRSAHASGPMVTGGGALSEPTPRGARASVVRAQLVIDMRPTRHQKPARVVARYAIRHDGPAQPHGLIAPASALAGVAVRYDGRAISSSTGMDPSMAGDEAPGAAFAWSIEPGNHTVEVEYEAEPEAFHRGIVDRYALSYDLTPARQWSSFERLQVRVLLPDGFEVLERPALLTMHDGELRGELARLPASLLAHDGEDPDGLPKPAPGTLRLQIAPAPGPYRWLAAIRWAGPGLAVVAPLGFAWALRQRRRSSRLGSLARVASLLSCLVVVGLLPMAAVFVQRWWLPHATFGAEHMAAVVLAWGVGLTLALAVHVRVGRAA